MTPEEFARMVGEVTSTIAGRALDAQLESDLNAHFPANGPVVARIAQACRDAVAAGWMCNRENAGIRYGRVTKPGPVTHEFSIDVVEMPALAGPHHRHPNGEIDLILPLEPEARFDGRPAGWLVYGPGSAHRPTVSGGRAHVLYLLPQGAIEFTKD
jgi:Domain of unknown function (DUF4863)